MEGDLDLVAGAVGGEDLGAERVTLLGWKAVWGVGAADADAALAVDPVAAHLVGEAVVGAVGGGAVAGGAEREDRAADEGLGVEGGVDEADEADLVVGGAPAFGGGRRGAAVAVEGGLLR
ncbi:MAG: hypothetical protein R3F65_07385 [bacterium]